MTELEEIIKNVLSSYPTQIKEFKEGNEKLLQFIIGKSMAAVKGKAPATLVKDIVIQLIKDF